MCPLRFRHYLLPQKNIHSQLVSKSRLFLLHYLSYQASCHSTRNLERNKCGATIPFKAHIISIVFVATEWTYDINSRRTCFAENRPSMKLELILTFRFIAILRHEQLHRILSHNIQSPPSVPSTPRMLLPPHISVSFMCEPNIISCLLILSHRFKYSFYFFQSIPNLSDFLSHYLHIIHFLLIPFDYSHYS